MQEELCFIEPLLEGPFWRAISNNGKCEICHVMINLFQFFFQKNLGIFYPSINCIFPKTKKDLVVSSRQCCLFCLLKR